jgi:predicted RNA binding protein YcfA (HicA-like mRNA interferase family)
MVRMPQVTASDLVRFLKSRGFVEDRQQGSHRTCRPSSHSKKQLEARVIVIDAISGGG